jgi:hypothetical protein
MVRAPTPAMAAGCSESVEGCAWACATAPAKELRLACRISGVVLAILRQVRWWFENHQCEALDCSFGCDPLQSRTQGTIVAGRSSYTSIQGAAPPCTPLRWATSPPALGIRLPPSLQSCCMLLLRQRRRRLPLLNIHSLCTLWVWFLCTLPALPSGTTGRCSFWCRACRAGPCQQQGQWYELV